MGLSDYHAELMASLAFKERRLPFTTLTEAVGDPSVEFYAEKSTVGVTFIQASVKN